MKNTIILMTIALFFGIFVSSASADTIGDGDIIIDHRIVTTSCAFGTVNIVGSDLFDELDALFTAHYLSDQMAQEAADDFFGGPPFDDLIEDFGILTNMEFLTTDLQYLGDPVTAVQSVFNGHLAYINSVIGGGATIEMSTFYAGTVSSQLYGGVVIQGDPTIVVTGTTNIAMYEVVADITVPDQSPPVPEPSTIILLGVGIVGIAGVTRRKLKK